MKNVAIVTLYGEYNIGNKLQNYAVEYLMNKAGCKPVTMVTTMYQPLSKRIKNLLIFALLFMPINKDRRITERRMMRKRVRKIEAFSKEYLHYSKYFDYRDKKVLANLNKEYDLFITGSDQVWGSFIDEDPDAFNYFFLMFADREKRGSIAPSLGRYVVKEDMQEAYAIALKEIRWLSCREKGMQQLIEKLSERKPQLLLDPTMCIPVEEWRRISRVPEYNVPKKYILDYRLGTDKDRTDRIVEDISAKSGFDVVNIYDTRMKNVIFEKTGPAEFLWLIDNASLVVTDSFHGCVFSILFNKNFVCIDRTETSKSVNMNDRLDTLLTRFNLCDRLYGQKVLDSLLDTNHQNTNKIIEIEAEKTEKYVMEMIERKVIM